ncbi:zinc finger CCCH domain-containing protein 28-like isoform X2 [Magnolia sinica]|uniref:zinc finger CCCH domain-containing protein 28-like isoform X2 n=1 Tax=Magnolia sinica TaxID=86752 RepID=UPI002659983B|nr:zinc finger CCCH domain-containing protein 28-like isoform X2 [Magnolia sinica]
MASNSPSKRKRSRSPNPSPVSSPDNPENCSDSELSRSKSRRKFDLSVDVCKDYIRDHCRRSIIDCKFAHPHPSVTIERNKVIACADSLRNQCFRGRTCRYYHPPPHIQESLRLAAGIQEVKVEMVCRDFMRGRCLREPNECRYAHHSPAIDDHAIVCQDFLHGKCKRKSCRYSHVLAHGMPQQHGAPMKSPGSRLQLGDDATTLPVCKDFLKRNCSRDSCKFAHPDLCTEVIDNQVEVCRDFLRGTCRRTGCRFYHPLATTSTAMSSGLKSLPLC